MRTTGFLVVDTIVLCAALGLAASGWRQPHVRPHDAVRHLHRRGEVPIERAGATRGFARIGHVLGDDAGAHCADRWEQPLRLIGRRVDVHLGILATAALGGLVVPPLVLATLQSFGVITAGWFVPLAFSIAAAFLVPAAVHGDAMSRADVVRLDLRHQLGAFIDMVTMLLAGNTGYEGALDEAARAGDGLLFRQLRRRMREVATTGHSLVGALSLVAHDYGIVELEQVAATTRLSANEGAPVARSLAAKCSTLRNTLAADEEAAARVRNDKVTPPLVGMALLFMTLIIYPALDLA